MPLELSNLEFAVRAGASLISPAPATTCCRSRFVLASETFESTFSRQKVNFFLITSHLARPRRPPEPATRLGLTRRRLGRFLNIPNRIDSTGRRRAAWAPKPQNVEQSPLFEICLLF